MKKFMLGVIGCCMTPIFSSTNLSAAADAASGSQNLRSSVVCSEEGHQDLRSSVGSGDGSQDLSTNEMLHGDGPEAQPQTRWRTILRHVEWIVPRCLFVICGCTLYMLVRSSLESWREIPQVQKQLNDAKATSVALEEKHLAIRNRWIDVRHQCKSSFREFQQVLISMLSAK
jgi:hypothetical protein